MSYLLKPKDTKELISVSLLLLILGALSAMGPLATDLYLPSFSLIGDYFQTDSGTVSISLSVFFFGLAGGQLFYGPLIDRYGRKSLLLAGVALFTLSSALIVIAPNIHFFIALRLLQALGSCSGMIIARAIIGDLYKEKEAARFFSLLMIITVIAPIVAPTLGGLLVLIGGWKIVFGVLTLFGVACFLLIKRSLPETLGLKKRKRVVLVEVLKTYGILLIQKNYILPTLVCAISYGELFAFISGSPFVYMNLYGVSPHTYGLLFGINAVGMICAAKINHALLKYFMPMHILWVCVAINVFFSFILLILANNLPLPALVGLILFSLIGIPSIGANAMALAMQASEDRRGSASALLGVLQFGVASLASALVGALHNGTIYPMVGVIFGCSLLSATLLALKMVKEAFNLYNSWKNRL